MLYFDPAVPTPLEISALGVYFKPVGETLFQVLLQPVPSQLHVLFFQGN